MSSPNPSVNPPQWRKSRRSYEYSGQCVEAAMVDAGVAVRDSKNPSGPMLTISAYGWAGFLRAVKAGAHDLPS